MKLNGYTLLLKLNFKFTLFSGIKYDLLFADHIDLLLDTDCKTSMPFVSCSYLLEDSMDDATMQHVHVPTVTTLQQADHV